MTSMQRRCRRFLGFSLLLYGILPNVFAFPLVDNQDGDEVIISVVDDISALWVGFQSKLFLEKSNVYVTVTADIEPTTGRIISFEILTGDAVILLPENILNKVIEPRFETMEVVYVPVALDDKTWTMTVSFEFAARPPELAPNSSDRETFVIEIGVTNDSLLDVTIFDLEKERSEILFEGKSAQ